MLIGSRLSEFDHSPLTNAIFDLGALAAALGAVALLLDEILGTEGVGRLSLIRPDPAMDWVTAIPTAAKAAPRVPCES